MICHFYSGDALRSRSVSDVVLHDRLDVPAPSARLLADWDREIARLQLDAAEVQPLSLARARVRWPDYRQVVGAVSDWMRTLALPDLLPCSDVALMVCRGTKYHHDGDLYGGAAFCNLFLSPDKGLDLHFPGAGVRMALHPGTVVVFDTCQPHAVVARRASGYDAADFAPERDGTLLFLSWELPMENLQLARTMGVALDVAPGHTLPLHEGQVQIRGARSAVCPQTGQWHPVQE
jgi:hypothetical protein